jgi:hypothetical protein
VRRISIIDFADRAQTRLVEVGCDPPQKGERLLGVVINLEVGKCKRAEKPTPHGSLVIDGVTIGRPT